eukprot:4447640-Prymnesium_polylepis.1
MCVVLGTMCGARRMRPGQRASSSSLPLRLQQQQLLHRQLPSGVVGLQPGQDLQVVHDAAQRVVRRGSDGRVDGGVVLRV